MLTAAGALLVVAAFGAAGFALAREKKSAALCAEGYALLFKHIRMRLPSLEVLESIVADFENPALETAGVLSVLKDGRSAVPCNKRLLAAIELQKDDGELYSVLLPAARELGSTDYERQTRSLDDTVSRLEALSELRRSSLEGSERCCRWLGVLAGVMTAILLL